MNATTTITRANYDQFCTEPPMTQDEQRDWRIMCAAIRAEMRRGTPDSWPLYQHIMDSTSEERAAHQAASIGNTTDWADMVGFADTCRAQKRAEIAAWHRFSRDA